MLHAVYCKKAKLSDVTGEGKRNPEEDLTTSAVFGPLTYLRDDAKIFLDGMMHTAGFPSDKFFADCDTIKFEFWHKYKKASGGYVEPDLVIEGRQSSRRVNVLIIEVKWAAELHDCQLQDQWDAVEAAYQFEDDFQSIRHIFLPKRRTPTDIAQLQGQQAKLFTWYEFSQLISVATKSHYSDGFHMWAEDVRKFLEIRGVRAQLGWNALKLTSVCTLKRWRLCADHMPNAS